MRGRSVSFVQMLHHRIYKRATSVLQISEPPSTLQDHVLIKLFLCMCDVQRDHGCLVGNQGTATTVRRKGASEHAEGTVVQ